MNRTLITATIYVCFLFSGAAALIYEIVWQRMLMLVFGVSAWSITAVLTAFMAGLALGSWFVGRIADRSRNPVRSYAFIEFSIAIGAVAVSFAIDPLMSVYVQIAHAIEPGFLGSHLIRFVLAFVIFLVPSTLLGATMPFMSRIAAIWCESIGSAFGWIYAINTMGSVAGAALAGFWLIPTIGMHNTAYVALTGNVTAGLLALLLSFGTSLRAQPMANALQPQASDDDVRDPKSGLTLRHLHLVAATLGFLGLGYEVAWSRLLAVYTLNSVYVFTMLMTVFLGGLAIGGGIAAIIVRRAREHIATILGYVQFAMAMTGPLVLLFTKVASEWAVNLQMGIGSQVFWLEYEITLGFVFLPTIIMGMSLPLLIELIPDGMKHPGGSVGRAYAMNAWGTVIGTALTGLLFIPWFGIRASLILLSVGNFILACVIMPKPEHAPTYRRQLIPIAAIVFILASTFVPQNTQFHRQLRDPMDAVVYYKEGQSAVVHIEMSEYAHKIERTLFVDSLSVAGTAQHLVTDQKMLAHLPLLLHPNPKRAISVGFGTGGTSYSMKQHGIETHCVEIDKAVPAASRFFFEQNHGAVGLEQGIGGFSKFRLILDDARSWFHLATEPYDVIVDDLTSLQYKNNGNLYTVECFELIKKNLTPDGVACAWVPVAGIDEASLKTVIQSFREVFPHTSVWYFSNVLNYFVVLIGTPEPLSVDIKDWRSRMTVPDVYYDLEEVGLTNPYDLAASVLLTEEEVARFVGDAPLHTDDKPILDYQVHASFYKETLSHNLRAMLNSQSTPRTDWTKRGDPEIDAEYELIWERWRDSRPLVVRAHSFTHDLDHQSASELYLEAANMVPESVNIARFAGVKAMDPNAD
ncbi:MAG TPA: fused MFS/spermidine synthase [Phycisphaerae bacterium]|nr:fused MFS/spermidine synthase [Phycisphaerae bacterium]